LTLGVAEFDLPLGLPTGFLALTLGVAVDTNLPIGISTFNELTRFFIPFFAFDLFVAVSSGLLLLVPFVVLFVIFNGLSPIKPLQFLAPHLHGALSLLTDSKL